MSAPTIQKVGVILLGWLTFFILWTLFILGYGQGEVRLAMAALSGGIATVTAAALSFFVWRFTGRLPWPEQGVAGFMALHLLAALLFAALWTALGPIVGVAIEGESLSAIEWSIPVNSWRLLMGVWLYVILAGLSYAGRIHTRLREQRVKAAQAEALASETRLAALRSQLHPHFLFNALHSVSSLIHSDPEQATDAMEQLGDLLRYAIRDHGEDEVLLSEEWAFVMDYLRLQKIRQGDRLQVQAEIQPEAQSVRVPVFVLQPLVENAVMHGLADQIEGGTIVLRATVEAEVLHLVVEDDGRGYVPSPSSGGTGLSTLAARLESLYGDGATLKVRARDGGGTHATVTLSDRYATAP